MSTPALVGRGRTLTTAELREKQLADDLAARQARNAAALQAAAQEWKKREPSAIIAEIEKDGARRLFLSEDGAVMVRGRGTAEHLKIVACLYAREPKETGRSPHETASWAATAMAVRLAISSS
jgi:hypothetical protein